MGCARCNVKFTEECVIKTVDRLGDLPVFVFKEPLVFVRPGLREVLTDSCIVWISG